MESWVIQMIIMILSHKFNNAKAAKLLRERCLESRD